MTPQELIKMACTRSTSEISGERMKTVEDICFIYFMYGITCFEDRVAPRERYKFIEAITSLVTFLKKEKDNIPPGIYKTIEECLKTDCMK